MSRMSTLAAALVVCWGLGSTCLAEDAPGTGAAGGRAADHGSLSGVPTSPNRATPDVAKEQEDRIKRALNDLVDLQFADTPLSDVVDYCANRLEINVFLDNKGLTDAGVDPSAPVTFATRKPITFASALNLILDEFDLAFAIQNEVLLITSNERAEKVLTTEVHYVGDLVVTGGSKRPNFGPLMNLITSTVQPDTWDDNDGPGSIQPFPATGSLVFSQKQDVHVAVADLLAKLRRELKEHSTRDEGLVLRSYPLGTASGDQTAEAIKKLIAPPTWQRNGGEGEICVVNQRTRQPGHAEAVSSDVLVVRQTFDVHDQIADLLGEMLMYRMGGGMSGGSGNGGGMFRVPDSR
jgi:hypothetical protein